MAGGMALLSRFLSSVLVLSALLAVGTVAPREDDTSGRCGVQLVLRNPDLREQEDGFIHASGWFFIQFQAVGEGAENVAYFTFSFGKASPNDFSTCQVQDAWITGIYLKDYRGDYNPDDGFFVPINTTLVPDGEYGAAVHAYDSADNEIGRFWVEAIVDNCDGGDGARCGTDQQQVVNHDNVLPWPIILPGDGAQTNPVDGITIEFAEALQSASAYINGEPLNLMAWEGNVYDDDATPGNDGQGGATDITCAAGQNPVCTKRHWGPAYKWEGFIEANDIIKVVAVDLAGNTAVKIVHLLDPNAGGIIAGDEINIDMVVDASEKEVAPGEGATFNFTLTNAATVEAHVSLTATGPTGLEFRWNPDHVVVPAGETAQAGLTATPPGNVTRGTFEFTARAEYQSGTELRSKDVTASVVVGEGGEVVAAEPETTGATDLDIGSEDSPGIGLALTVGALAMAVAILSRRRT